MVGDLGNIRADQFGQVNNVQLDRVATIDNSPNSIMGRAVVVCIFSLVPKASMFSQSCKF